LISTPASSRIHCCILYVSKLNRGPRLGVRAVVLLR
jgi:hypothetical protein